MNEITHYSFKNNVRSTLRYTHGFEHKDLERVHGVFTDTLTKLKTPDSLHAGHFVKAMEEMHRHPEWQHFSERQRDAITSTLRHHLSIKETPSKDG